MANDVSLNRGSQKKTVGIPKNCILLNNVVVGASALQTDAKVVQLGQVTISA